MTASITLFSGSSTATRKEWIIATRSTIGDEPVGRVFVQGDAAALQRLHEALGARLVRDGIERQHQPRYQGRQQRQVAGASQALPLTTSSLPFTSFATAVLRDCLPMFPL